MRLIKRICLALFLLAVPATAQEVGEMTRIRTGCTTLEDTRTLLDLFAAGDRDQARAFITSPDSKCGYNEDGVPVVFQGLVETHGDYEIGKFESLTGTTYYTFRKIPGLGS